MVLLSTGRVVALFSTPVGKVLACFLLWQAACTAPYLQDYGLDALRDGVLWGIPPLFALISAALILRLSRSLTIVVKRYARFARTYLYLGPIVWLATLYLGEWLPTWTGTRVTVPLVKGDEYGVHLAGIFAFSVLGLAGNPWWALIILADAMLAMNVRSGLLAFVCTAAVTLLFRPKIGAPTFAILVGVAIILAMSTFDVRLAPPGAARSSR